MSAYSFRITTNGVLRNYRSNLFKSYDRLNTSMERVQTERKFNSYAEDPIAASRGFQLRRELWRTNDQINNTNSTASKFQTGFSAMGFICDGDTDHPGVNGIVASLTNLNDTTGDARSALAQDMESQADSVLQLLNVTYGGDFVFAGADCHEVPFTWKLDDKGKRVGLLYRGIDLDTPDPDDWDDATLKAKFGPDADFEKVFGMTKDEARKNYDKLKELTKETTYVDIGLGMDEDENGAVPTSAYDTALSGLNFIGYGLDEDGDPKNTVSLLLRMADVARNYDGDKAARLYGKLVNSVEGVGEARVEVGAKVTFLNANVRQLQNTETNLNEQRHDIENIDPALAITELSYASYCYNAALKIGNSILSGSLLDYMK